MSNVGEVVSRPFAAALVDYAQHDERVVCVTNDLTASCEADEFRDRFPGRYLSLGMAEQNLVGVLSGLAREGLIPVYTSFAVFVTRRPYEQLALNIAYPALPVRLIGFLPGLSTPGGVTHQSIDDLALMRTLPNMTVLEVGDATEIDTIRPVLQGLPGPVYCRMLRGDVPRRFSTPFDLHKPRVLTPGADVVIISSGLMTERVTEVVVGAQKAGLDVGHVHVSVLKPLPAAPLSAIISATKYGAITVENHLRSGGLGSAVAELIADAGLGRRLIRIGIDDTFTCGGEMDYLLERFGLGRESIARALCDLVPGLAPTDILWGSASSLTPPSSNPDTQEPKVEAL
jgi:transketolase